MITSSHTNRPIVETPDTPRSPKFYTNEELEQEKSIVRATQVDVAIKFEDKLRDTIFVSH